MIDLVFNIWCGVAGLALGYFIGKAIGVKTGFKRGLESNAWWTEKRIIAKNRERL